MFGKRLSFTKRRTHEIPGPQTEHRRQGMFVKPTLFAQLVCSHVRMLHTLNTPAFSRSEGVAERGLQQHLQLVAEPQVVDIWNQIQTLFQMTDGFVVRRTSR